MQFVLESLETLRCSRNNASRHWNSYSLFSSVRILTNDLKKAQATSEPLCMALRTRGWESGSSFAQLRSHTSAIRHPPLNRGLWASDTCNSGKDRSRGTWVCATRCRREDSDRKSIRGRKLAPSRSSRSAAVAREGLRGSEQVTRACWSTEERRTEKRRRRARNQHKDNATE